MENLRIVFFNHKGGVSKTTTTFNLGWKLAEKGKKVLLVDADPQCNLTGLIMNDNFEEYYYNDNTKYNNIKDGVASAFTGQPEPIKAVECYSIPRNNNLFLLPGHPNLSEFDPQLSFAQTAQNAFTVMQNLPGSFNSLIEQTSLKYNIDYVLIDLNPSLSAINQNLFSISDLFIIPTNPDPFSLMALKTLNKIIPEWKRLQEQMFNIFDKSSYPFPNRKQLFGGIIIQRFNIRNGKPATPFRNNMNELIDYVKESLYPNLFEHNLAFSKEVYNLASIQDDFCLAEIPDFQSLLPQSNKFGVPVYALTDDEIGKTGKVLKQMKKKKQEFDELFNDLANKVEILLENVSL